jgi:hypothetical protein
MDTNAWILILTAICAIGSAITSIPVIVSWWRSTRKSGNPMDSATSSGARKWLVVLVVATIALIFSGMGLYRTFQAQSISPLFEVAHGTVITGNATRSAADVTVRNTLVMMPIIVYNHGTPSVIRSWEFTATLRDGSELKGLAFNQRGNPLTVTGPDGLPIEIESGNSIFIKGGNPIPTGGQADGYAIFLFPPGLQQMMEQAGTKFVLELQDINGKKYPLEIVMTGTPATVFYGR